MEARNLEYKASVDDLDQLEGVFKANGAVFKELMIQTDTYFDVQRGRLKFREINGKTNQVIFYERDESSVSQMVSDYQIFSLTDPSMKHFLVQALGVKAIVKKRRKLLRLQNARIHLDEIPGVGNFLEFEIIAQGDHTADGLLLDRLKLLSSRFVKRQINVSYCDIVLSKFH